MPPNSTTWYSSTDNLRGTQAVGDPTDDSNEWSIVFSGKTYDKFLFASGDFTIWAQALVTEVGPGGDYTRSTPRNVVNSSSSASAYTSDWWNINASVGAPRIQLNQRSIAETEYNWLYLADSS